MTITYDNKELSIKPFSVPCIHQSGMQLQSWRSDTLALTLADKEKIKKGNEMYQ